MVVGDQSHKEDEEVLHYGSMRLKTLATLRSTVSFGALPAESLPSLASRPFFIAAFLLPMHIMLKYRVSLSQVIPDKNFYAWDLLSSVFMFKLQ